jgi:long-subunit acyl-CoA synthetase (AMP-forming)
MIYVDSVGRLSQYCPTRTAQAPRLLPQKIRNNLPRNVVYGPEAILALIYASGTATKTKGVMVTHDSMLSDIPNVSYRMRYTECAILLHAAAIYHIAAEDARERRVRP